jgi:uncharacterized protein
MSGFFFGPPDRQLFGYHHVPRGAARGAVVLCAPWGWEYDFSHRALLVLAKRLAAGGSHVLRFDYTGTGDSWGETTEADLLCWRDDTGLAIKELRSMSGVETVDLVGLRLGAYVAAQAAVAHPEVRRLILWDPIVDGRLWLRELRATPATVGQGLTEAGNALVSPLFIRQLEEISSGSFQRGSAAEVFLLLTQMGGGTDADPETLSGLGAITMDRMEQPAPWVEDESIWTGQVPVQAIGRISEWLT